MSIVWAMHHVRFCPFFSALKLFFLCAASSAFSLLLPQKLFSLDENSLASNYQIFDLSWDTVSNSFLIDGVAFPNLTLYDNNDYIFRINSAEQLLIAEHDFTYTGTELFENNTTGPNRYVVFSPQSANSDNRLFYYLNPSFEGNLGEIETFPFIKSSLLRKCPPQKMQNLVFP